MAELAGADGITVHLRADRRHIQERDLYLLRETVRGRLNVEAAMSPDALKVLQMVKPDFVTLVPERAEEVTTEGGLDLKAWREEVAEYIALYREAGIGISLFINPDPDTMKVARKLKPDCVELNTLEYGAAVGDAAQAKALRRVGEAARVAGKAGIEVHAGHDINYRNAAALQALPLITEASIGHAIIARAALVGLDRAVREMREALS
jgi:pyridoxine 5-phosphate synthase